jgi:hypothetical protein
MLTSLAKSIKEQSPSSFDDGFSRLARFLDRFEKKKKRDGVYTLEIVPKRTAFINRILQLGLQRDLFILIVIFVVILIAPNAKDIVDFLSRLF